MSRYKGVPELLMNMRTVADPLSLCFAIGTPSEVTTTLLLVRYCLLVVTTGGVVSASVEVPEAASFDL
jgi:hypothetical protein